MSEAIRVGVIGCGAICGNYLTNGKKLPQLEFVACADLFPERAEAVAEEHGIARWCSPEELIALAEVEVVLNLTVPAAHGTIARACVEAGKHVYNEKPFSLNREEGRALLEASKAAGLEIGCAPDTVLGAGVQTARKALDEGVIGRPVAFSAFMLSRGPETFHPDPFFFYQPGGGPMFDMGPYYLTTLLNLFGPVKRIAGIATEAITERTIAKGPKAGQAVPVHTSDHVCGLLEFECGVAGTLTTSFAVMHGHYERPWPILIYGTEGAMKVPDPNTFDGSVWVRNPGDDEWREVPHAFNAGYGRSVGLADLGLAVRCGRQPRCSGDQGFAVLDLMQGFLDASASGTDYRPSISYERPVPMPEGVRFGELE